MSTPAKNLPYIGQTIATLAADQDRERISEIVEYFKQDDFVCNILTQIAKYRRGDYPITTMAQLVDDEFDMYIDAYDDDKEAERI